MKTPKKIYKIQRKINNHPQRIMKSKSSYNTGYIFQNETWRLNR